MLDGIPTAQRKVVELRLAFEQPKLTHPAPAQSCAPVERDRGHTAHRVEVEASDREKEASFAPRRPILEVSEVGAESAQSFVGRPLLFGLVGPLAAHHHAAVKSSSGGQFVEGDDEGIADGAIHLVDNAW